MAKDMRRELLRHVDGLEVVSTHEHHEADGFHAGLTLDRIFGMSYVGWCGVPVGKTEEEHARFLQQVRHNTYYVWLEKALQRLYGVEGRIMAGNWEEVSGRIREAHEDRNWHLRILKEKCRYRAEVQDTYSSPGSDRGHPEIFKPTYRINMFLYGYHEEVKDHNGNNPLVMYGERPADFGAYLDFVQERIERAKAQGCVALKSALAYDREIAFGEPVRAEAAAAYGRHPSELTEEQKRAFGDYVFNYILRTAARLGLPMQVHTGLGLIAGSNPIKMVGTIARYPEVRFDLFHGGYPWTGEAAGIAHNYPNVWLDLCWLPLISTTAARRALGEWIDVAGSCERIVWGADTWTSEESLGAVTAARHVVAEVLAERVQAGMTDIEGAKDLAGKILCGNARRLFGI